MHKLLDARVCLYIHQNAKNTECPIKHQNKLNFVRVRVCQLLSGNNNNKQFEEEVKK